MVSIHTSYSYKIAVWSIFSGSGGPTTGNHIAVATLEGIFIVLSLSQRPQRIMIAGSVFSPMFLSPSGDLGIGLVWDNPITLSIPHFGPSVEIFSKLNFLSMMGPQLFSGWYQMFLDIP